MLQVYHGRGKGKTSAAIGAAVRAAGRGWPVLLAQFLKDAASPSGETAALRLLSPKVTFLRARLPYSVAEPPSAKALEEMKKATMELLEDVDRRVSSAKFSMVVLDELGMALTKGWLNRKQVEPLLKRLVLKNEVIVTGRRVPSWLIRKADLVTRMINVRHPYDRGVRARKGIEY